MVNQGGVDMKIFERDKEENALLEGSRVIKHDGKYYRDMSESEYERLKEKVWKGAKMKNGIMKYHPAFIAQRRSQSNQY